MRRYLPYAAVGLVAAVSIAVGCNVPDYQLVDNLDDASTDAVVDTIDGAIDTRDTGTADTGTADDADTGEVAETGCTSSKDCAGNKAKPVCDVPTGACVPCTPTEDVCAKGEYCTAENKCATGCKNDADCTAAPPSDAGADAADESGADAAETGISVLKCEPTTHTCRGCKVDDECPAGTLCDVPSATCKPGCTDAHKCITGKDCCTGSCFDLASDTAHCGKCDTICAADHGTPGCAAGACTIAKCDTGFGDCDKKVDNGCEQTLTTTAHCGGCGVACAPASGTGECSTGTCTISKCDTGFDDCDKKVDNGCEQALNTNAHCGGCGVKCSATDGTASCATGTCLVTSCLSSYADCNKSATDGCEVDTSKDAANCGGCGTVCPSTRGTPMCVGSTCKYSSCVSGFGDCDGSKTCATKTTDDVANCGGCGTTCSVAAGTAKCTGTTCGVASCNPGFNDCNGSYSDGCEQSLTTVTSCGACGVGCARTKATATCATGSCKIASCDAGFGNCDTIDSNGCETDTKVTTAHCGGCGLACVTPGGTPSCVASTCTVASCNAGLANCDASATTGCERAMNTIQNTCAAAPNLVSATTGLSTICGNGGSNELTTAVTNFGERYYRLRLTRCGSCGSADPTRASITVTSPVGMAFDLFVYSNTTCTTLFGSSTSGVLGGTETVKFVDTSCPNPKDILIRVKWRAGDGCGLGTLVAKGAYTPYP